jgi:hypothetical protein
MNIRRKSKNTNFLILIYFHYVYPYHSRFILDGVAEASRVFLRDAHVLPKRLSYEEY